MTNSNPKSMSLHADEYLALRRQLGGKLVREGYLLREFARYVDESGHRGPITSDLVMRWVRRPTKAAPNYLAQRLLVVRRFVRHLALEDPRTEIPAEHDLKLRRISPHIYTKQQICDLLAAAAALSPSGGLRPQTYRTLFGLLASTGMRVGEAIRLQRDNVDLESGVLRIANSKPSRSRLVPVHDSVLQTLRQYAAFRDRYHSDGNATAFLLSESGNQLHYDTVHGTFAQIRDRLGWKRFRRWPSSQDPRLTPQLRLPSAARVVSRRRRHRARHSLAGYLPGAYGHRLHLLVPDRCPRTARDRRCAIPSVRPFRAKRWSMSKPYLSPPFSALLQDFFCQCLINQRNASVCTIAAYRDTFRLLLQYLEQVHETRPTDVTLADLDAPRILAFLDYLQDVRKNSVRSRNARLAALRSFFKYAASRDPASLPLIQRILAIPMKRYDRCLLGFLSREEIQALLDCARSSTMEWPTRPTDVDAALQHGCARVGNHRLARGRRVAGTRDKRSNPGKGPQAAVAPALEKHGDRLAAVDETDRFGARIPTTAELVRRSPEQIGGGKSLEKGRFDGCGNATNIDRPIHLAPYHPSHDSNAPAAIGRRSLRYCDVAWPRKHRYDTHVYGNRPDDERARARKAPAGVFETVQISPDRQAAPVPGKPVIMQSPRCRPPPASTSTHL